LFCVRLSPPSPSVPGSGFPTTSCCEWAWQTWVPLMTLRLLLSMQSPFFFHGFLSPPPPPPWLFFNSSCFLYVSLLYCTGDPLCRPNVRLFPGSFGHICFVSTPPHFHIGIRSASPPEVPPSFLIRAWSKARRSFLKALS